MPISTTARPPWRERLQDLPIPQVAAPTEVLPHLWRIPTGGADSYLVLGDDITLIDTGTPGSGDGILETVQALGRSVEDIRTILITHYHIDHVGGLAEIQRHVPAWTGVHSAEAPAITSHQPLPTPFKRPFLSRIVDPYLEARDPGPARVDQQLADGDELPGLGGIRIVHTPGHTPGSISLHFPELGAIVIGDAMQFRFGRLMLPNRLFTQDMDEAVGAIRKLARLDFDTLCFSHYRPIRESAGAELRAFTRTLLP